MAAKKRPIVAVPRSPLTPVLEAIGLLSLATMIIVLAVNWSSLPDIIPIHFGWSGKPDGYGSKWVLVIIPALATILYATFSIMSRFPHTFNYPWPITQANAPRQYYLACTLLAWIKVEIALFYAFLTWQMIDVARNNTDGLNPLFAPAFVLTVFATIGFYLWLAVRSR